MTAATFLFAFVIAIIITVLEGKIMKKDLEKMTVEELLDAYEGSSTSEGKKYLDELYRRDPEAVQNWIVDETNKPLRDFFSQNIYVVEEHNIANFFSKIVFVTTNKAKADAYVFAQKSEPYRWHKLVIWKDGEEKC